MSKYGQIIDEIEAEDSQLRVRGASLDAPALDPDSMGRAMKLADERGLPPGVVANSLGEYDQQRDLDNLGAAAGTNPVLSRWLGDPNHSAVAKDDTSALASIGKLMAEGMMHGRGPVPGMVMPGSIREAEEQRQKSAQPSMSAVEPTFLSELVGKYQAGWFTGKAGAATIGLPDLRSARTRELEERVAKGFGYASAEAADIGRTATYVADQNRQAQGADRESEATRRGFEEIAAADKTGSTAEVIKAVGTNPRAVMSVVAQSLGTATPQLAVSLAMPASRVASATAAGASSFGIEQGNTILDVMQDAGIDTADAAQVGAFLNDKQKMAKARDKALKRGVAVGTFDALTAGFAGRLLVNSRRSLVSIGSRVAGEAGVQAGGGAAGEASAQLLSEGKISSRADIVLEAAAEVPTFLVEARGRLAEARRNALNNADRFDAAQEQRSIGRLVDLASQSKTRERSATRFESLVQQMTTEGEDTVYLSAEGARTLFQSAQGDLEAGTAPGLEGLIDPDQLREAMATGGEIAIPLSAYATRMTLELHAAIADQVRLKPGGQHDVPAVSPEEIQAAIDEGLAEAAQQDERENGPAGQVYDDIYGQLLSRQDERLARQNASVVQSVYRNLAERTGTDAWTLYQQFKINIPGASTDRRAAPRGVDIDVDPFLDALRSGQLPTDADVYGQSLSSALQAAGGLQDSGGELANMDARQRPGLISLAGMTLDDALTWAYQEGFIAEAPTQFRDEYSDAAPDINTLLDLLAQDLGGNPVYRPGAMNAERASFRERAQGLQDELDQRGINLQEVGNEAARQLLGYGRTLDQSPAVQEFTATTPGGTFRLTDERAPAGADFSEFGEVRIIEAFDGDEKVGQLLYANDGTPPTIEVDAAHRRKGIATAMLKLAKQQGGVLGSAESGMRRDGGRPTYRTDDGQAFRANADESRVTIEPEARTLFQSAQVNTPEFSAWFGDSKVVDTDGNPLVVYHGTNADFDSFKPSRKFGDAYFASQDTGYANALADGEGANIMPLYASLQNPFEIPYSSYGIDALETAWAANHDGLIATDGDGVKKVVVAFSPEQFKSATGNSGAFDSANPSVLMQGGDKPRGSVTFGGGPGARTFDVQLLKGMDASTFMHEMGHVYLEVLNDLAARPEAPAQITADMATLNEWLGRAEGEAFTTEQHEQFARGWEAYLREGSAPSSALRRTFAAFKVWLTALYRSVRQLNVELTDDVRSVMDRLVASDAEIAEARTVQYQEALITDAVAVGMTPEQFEAYNAAVLAARADAEATVAAELLRAQQLEQRAWYNREKRAVRAEVTEELRNTQVYRTSRILRTGKMPDGELAPDELRVKLSKDDLLDHYGQSFLKNLRGMYSVEGGVTADVAATLYGYGSGREMIDALVNAPRLSDAAAAETDARMAVRHPDPMTDGTLPDRAMIAAHRDRQASIMEREIRALERHLTGREVSQSAVVKGIAKGIIAQKKLRHLQPATYRAAEAKAGREAFQAAAAQDWPAALAARRRQLLNFELFREAVRARDEAARAAKYLGKFSETKTRARLGKAGADYLDQVDGLLDRFDFRKISDKASDRRASLAAWVQRQSERGIDVNLPQKLLDETFTTPYREMTMQDLLGLRDAVRAIDHLARLKGKLLLGNEVRDAAEIDAAMAASLREAMPERQQTTGARDWKDSARTALLQVRGIQATATDIARELDGFKDQGAIWRNTVGVMREAVNNQVNPRLQQAQDDLAQIYVKHYTKEQIRQFSDRFPAPEVNGDLWTKSRLLALALNWGNAGNREAILTQARNRMTEQQATALLRRLDARDWAFVQDVWGLIDAQWPGIAEAQKRRTGLVPERVTPEPFVIRTVDGQEVTVRGGYYPLKYEGDSVRTMREEADDFYNSIRTGRSAKASTKNGHTIERVGSGGRTVKLDTTVIQSHLRDVIRDVYLGDAVNYVHNVLNGPEFREAVDATGAQEYHKAMELWLKDAAAGEIGPRIWHERAWRAARQNFTASVLTFKVTSALLQLSGVVPTAVVLGPQNTMAGISKYLNQPRSMTDYVRQASPYMDSRLRTHIEAVQTVMDAEAGRFKAGQAAAIRMGYWMIGRVQGVVDTVTWLAAEEAGRAKFGGDAAAARAYADDVVSRAQGSGEFIDKSPLQRGTAADNIRQTEWVKAVTALQGYMIAKGNLAYEQTRKANLRDPRQAMKWMADMVMLFAVEGLLTAALTGKLPKDDEDDGLADDLGGFVLKDALSTFFGVIPGGGTLVDQFRGYDSGGVVSDAFGAIADLKNKIFDENGETELDKGVIKAAVKTGGVTMGIPSTQINKTIDAIEARRDGRDVSPWEYLTGPKKDDKK